jgi:hypothetical protein
MPCLVIIDTTNYCLKEISRTSALGCGNNGMELIILAFIF